MTIEWEAGALITMTSLSHVCQSGGLSETESLVGTWRLGPMDPNYKQSYLFCFLALWPLPGFRHKLEGLFPFSSLSVHVSGNGEYQAEILIDLSSKLFPDSQHSSAPSLHLPSCEWQWLHTGFSVIPICSPCPDHSS